MSVKTVLLLTVAVFIGGIAEARSQTSSANSISIEHPWARATSTRARTGAAYLTILNHGQVGDRLVAVSTPLAAKVEVHQETDDQGVMRMRELPVVEVGPGATITFTPGSIHIMMVGLKQQLREGQSFPLALEFEKAGKIELQVPIAKAGAMGDHDMSGMQ